MITFKDVEEAQGRIGTFSRETPLLESASLSSRFNSKVFLKLENMQVTGSFKIRGAANKLLSVQKSLGPSGVVAASAGNHAQGVALMATTLKIKSTIVMPEATPLIKVTRTKALGAQVVLHGENFDEAFSRAKALSEETGAMMIPAFDDPLIMAGQGTVGLEILKTIPDPAMVIIPIGGGGLMGGIATAVKFKHPQTKIIGVQTENSPNVGRLVLNPKESQMTPVAATIAEGIAVKHPVSRVVEYLHGIVDDVVFVTEDEIAEALLYLLEKEKTVVEGAGAASLAALLSGKLRPPVGQKTVIVSSGGNVDPKLVGSIIERGLSRAGRMCGLKFVMDDQPGMLLKICQVVAQKKGNVLQVYHHRDSPKISVGETEIEIHLETKGGDHQKELIDALRAADLRCERLF